MYERERTDDFERLIDILSDLLSSLEDAPDAGEVSAKIKVLREKLLAEK